MPNQKILIVDDDREFLAELGEIIRMSGYEMVAVEDPDKVLDIARAQKPDVFLLDLRMPGKNGFELAGELRDSEEFFRTPIIAMSGFFKKEYMPLLEMCGIERCLRKPFNALDIIAYIENAVS